MPLRLYAWLRLITPVVWALCALYFVPAGWPAARRIGLWALGTFVALGTAGALLALIFLFTGVRFRCPFCARWGPGNLHAKGLPSMECPSCGEVAVDGFLGLRFLRGAPPPPPV
jgi:hypothetical protein